MVWVLLLTKDSRTMLLSTLVSTVLMCMITFILVFGIIFYSQPSGASIQDKRFLGVFAAIAVLCLVVLGIMATNNYDVMLS